MCHIFLTEKNAEAYALPWRRSAGKEKERQTHVCPHPFRPFFIFFYFFFSFFFPPTGMDLFTMPSNGARRRDTRFINRYDLFPSLCKSGLFTAILARVRSQTKWVPLLIRDFKIRLSAVASWRPQRLSARDYQFYQLNLAHWICFRVAKEEDVIFLWKIEQQLQWLQKSPKGSSFLLNRAEKFLLLVPLTHAGFYHLDFSKR